MQSTWKTPQLGRKPRGSNKPRTRGHPESTPSTLQQTPLSAAASSAASSPSTAKSPWASVPEEKTSHVGRKGERSRSSSKALHHHHRLHHHQTRSCDAHRDPPPQPPISKMDSCHISEDRGPWDSIRTENGMGTGAGAAVLTASSSPPAPSSPGIHETATVARGGATRLRLSRQGKSRGRGVSGGGGLVRLGSTERLERDLPLPGKEASLLDTAETDGYFSDGEQSDSDTHSGGRKLRLSQLHSGNEDLLRRSVLAS